MSVGSSIEPKQVLWRPVRLHDSILDLTRFGGHRVDDGYAALRCAS